MKRNSVSKYILHTILAASGFSLVANANDMQITAPEYLDDEAAAKIVKVLIGNNEDIATLLAIKNLGDLTIEQQNLLFSLIRKGAEQLEGGEKPFG